MVRLPERKLKKCAGCDWRIYRHPTTGLWYDMVHHDTACAGGLHEPKEETDGG